MRNIVWRLLRRNISTGQLAGYALANLVGLAIVITAMQFYRDTTAALTDNDSFITRDYLILSRKVEGLDGLLGKGTATFSTDDISDIASQPWVRRTGEFTASTYNVSASIDMGGNSMSTALFFESIPDDFFDVQPTDWTFDPSKPEVPIILSKDYLTLYNFGFASSRGLPQLSEAMIGMVPLRVSISGQGHQQWLPARIVGFSSRLNTIAVPEEFMDWANENFGEPVGDNQPSRLIVEVNSPGDPAIGEYLSSHGIETAGEKVDSSRSIYFLSIVTTVVIAVGAVISLLAFFILMLSIYLLLQKNRAKLHDLMLLGYSPADVSRSYGVMIVSINAGVLALSCAVMFVARHLWHDPMTAIGLNPVSPLPSLLTGVAIMTIITTINLASIYHTMNKYFKS